jgi:hypothetical protein
VEEYRANSKRDGASGDRAVARFGLLLAAAALLAGCGGGGISNPLPSVGNVLPNWFASAEKPTTSGSAAPSPVSVTEDCPSVDVRTGAGTLAVAANVAQPTANDVRYQLSFHELARQCFVESGSMRIRVGVQGRAVVGPAGAPPQVSVPIRYAVVREGVQPKTIVTKFRRTSVPVPPGSGGASFVDIEEDLSFPLPSRTEIQAYVVYVGFDDIGDRQERRGPPKKKKASPRRD